MSLSLHELQVFLDMKFLLSSRAETGIWKVTQQSEEWKMSCNTQVRGPRWERRVGEKGGLVEDLNIEEDGVVKAEQG